MDANSARQTAYEQRQDVYNNHLLPFHRSTPSFLGKFSFGKDFHAVRQDRLGNFEYFTPGGKQPLTALLFGEITAARGTNLGGLGNHRLPTKGEAIATIDDNTKVKNTVGLCCPSNCDAELARSYKNQIITLLNMVTTQNANESKKPSGIPYNLDDDTITVCLPKKFGRPKGVTAAPATIVAKVDPQTGESVDDGQPSVSTSADAAEDTSTGPSNTVVKKGEFYDPRWLPDYDPDIFNLKVDRLVQHDIVDIDNGLIPCWMLEEKLPPGTLCLFRVSIECYNIPRGNDTYRYHQLNCHQIRVIDTRLPSIFDHVNSATAGQRHGNHLDHAMEDFESFSKAKRAIHNNRRSKSPVLPAISEVSISDPTTHQITPRGTSATEMNTDRREGVQASQPASGKGKGKRNRKGDDEGERVMDTNYKNYDIIYQVSRHGNPKLQWRTTMCKPIDSERFSKEGFYVDNSFRPNTFTVFMPRDWGACVSAPPGAGFRMIYHVVGPDGMRLSWESGRVKVPAWDVFDTVHAELRFEDPNMIHVHLPFNFADDHQEVFTEL